MASQAFKEHILPLSYNANPTPCLLRNSLSFQFLLVQTSFPHKDCKTAPTTSALYFLHGTHLDKAFTQKAMPRAPTAT